MPIQENPGPANQGPATTFAPTSIAGCALWLDGKDPAGTGTPPSTGATVSTWVDKADGKNATATGSPTYLGGGGINFNGSAYFLNQTFTQNLSQRSIFIVMQETVRNNVYGVLALIPTPSSGTDFGTTTGFSVETSNGLRFYGMNGSYHSDIGNTSLLVKAIYNDNMNVTAGSGFVNGTNATNVNAGYTAGTCSGYGVASRWVGSISTSYALNGVIYEIIIFNTPLSLANRQNVEGYLAQKWGLTASLPLGHPGITTNYVASQSRIFRIGPLPGTRTPFVVTANQYVPPTLSVVPAARYSFLTAPSGTITNTGSSGSIGSATIVSATYTAASPSYITFALGTGYILAPSIAGIQTLILIVRVTNAGASNYLLDARPDLGGGWLYSGGPPIGPDWTSAVYYRDAVNTVFSGNPTQALQDSTWHHVCLQRASFTSAITFLARFTQNETLGCDCGEIMIFTSLLTAQQVKDNYNFFSGRFGWSPI
jgi:hypothetical protein